MKKQVVDSMPHYCHKGVIHAARELSMQLDNLAEDESAEQALSDCSSFKEIGGMSTILYLLVNGHLVETQQYSLLLHYAIDSRLDYMYLPRLL